MLEGTLDSFTLPDVFQLLAFTKKSGVLRLHHEDDTGEVYFREGQVTYALATTGRQALGRRLIGAGLVDTDTLASALDEQKKSREDGKGLRLGEVLVESGAIDESTLETFVREQVQDAVFDLMRWPDGAFVFEAGSGPSSEQIRLSVSVENLIMEGSRRLEEWDAVRKKIPSMKAVVAMAPLPGDTGVEVNLKPEEWRLLTLVDGRRTVRDLVDIFGQGEFATCKVLYGLVGAGLLEIRDPDLEGPPSVAALLQQQELLRKLEDDEGDLPEPTAEPVTGKSERSQPEAGEHQADEEEATSGAEKDEPSAEPDEVIREQPRARVHDRELDDQQMEIAEDQADSDDQEDEVPEASTSGAATKDEHEDEQLTTDPSIDEDLVRRLIEGVKDL